MLTELFRRNHRHLRAEFQTAVRVRKKGNASIAVARVLVDILIDEGREVRHRFGSTKVSIKPLRSQSRSQSLIRTVAVFIKFTLQEGINIVHLTVDEAHGRALGFRAGKFCSLTQTHLIHAAYGEVRIHHAHGKSYGVFAAIGFHGSLHNVVTFIQSGKLEIRRFKSLADLCRCVTDRFDTH